MEENNHFNLVQDKDGKWWRHCLASPDCIEKVQRFEKRVDMERHLKTKHKFTDVEVPPLPIGRPKSKEKRPASASERSRTQSEARFYNADLKSKNARNFFLRSKLKEAERKWENAETQKSKDEYIEDYVKCMMANWDERNASRMTLVHERITVGYEKSRRKRIEAHTSREQDIGTSKQTREEHHTPHARTSQVDTEPMAPQKLNVKRKRTMDMPISSRTRHSKEDVLKECHQPKFNEKSPKNESRVDIEVQHGNFDCKSPILQSPEALTKSLSQGDIVFHMKSTRFNFAADLHASMVNNTISVEASTKTMNIFSLWMENTLSVNVLEKIWFVDSLWISFLRRKMIKDSALPNFFGTPDLGRHVFTFFPIVDRSHWTLMVLYNPHYMRLSGLPRKRSCVLFFDSLGMHSPHKYNDCLYRVLAYFASFCSDPTVKFELLNPANEIGCQSIQIPQQPNGYDCGYYVMTCMQLLIEGGLGVSRPKSWLSRTWFKHEDVDLLKKQLFDWIQSAVGGLSITSP